MRTELCYQTSWKIIYHCNAPSFGSVDVLHGGWEGTGSTRWWEREARDEDRTPRTCSLVLSHFWLREHGGHLFDRCIFHPFVQPEIMRHRRRGGETFCSSSPNPHFGSRLRWGPYIALACEKTKPAGCTCFLLRAYQMSLKSGEAHTQHGCLPL